MSFVRDHYEGYDAPRLLVRLLRDSGGTPYLLLHGPEPDNRWEAFARAVREVIERLEVTRVVAMGSVPMAVPHTRPIAITPHANRPSWCPAQPVARRAADPEQRAVAAGGATGGVGPRHARLRRAHPALPRPARLPEGRSDPARAGRAGRPAHRRPHRAARAGREREGEIERYLAANEEVGEVVPALEQQYDAFERAEDDGSSLLASDQPLPTGEEIGQQFEQFLAGLDAPDGPGSASGAGLSVGDPTPSGPRCAPRPRDPRRGPLPRRASRPRPGPGCTAGRSPPRRWWPAPAAWTRSSCPTPSTPTSCCPATTPSRSSSTSSGSATAARSSPAGSPRGSTGDRSTTRRSTSRGPRRASTTRTRCPRCPAPSRGSTCST